MIKKGKQKFALWAVTALMLFATTITAMGETTDKFVPGTKINEVNVGNLTVDEAKAQMQQYYINEYKISLKSKEGTTETIAANEIGYSVVIPDALQPILDAQNAGGRVSGPATDNSHEIAVEGKFDEAALTAKINSLSGISGEGIQKTQDAHISDYQEGQPFTIIPETEGNDLNPERTIAAIKEAAAGGKTWVALLDAGCYNSVKVRAGDESLVNLLNTMNQTKDMTITYSIRGNAEVLEGKVIAGWITGVKDGAIEINSDMAAKYIGQLAAKYDTAGTVRTFKTVSGKEVSLTGPYGWKINQEAESAALMAMIRTSQTQSREPVYSLSASAPDVDWGKTYVEVDLTGQHVYMIKDGAVVWDAPCVTGNTSKDYTTPPGIFSLYYKERDKVLRGAKLADGTYEYESPVKYWMPFNGGIGLHDADWRSKFGGSIYQKSGSHGCVNLPAGKVPALFELVYKGIPILCYN